MTEAEFAVYRDRQKSLSEDVRDLEGKVDSVDRDIVELKSDVKYIRDAVESTQGKLDKVLESHWQESSKVQRPSTPLPASGKKDSGPVTRREGTYLAALLVLSQGLWEGAKYFINHLH